MRHRKSGRKFSRTAAHRKSLFKNLATSLILCERIQTTLPKAKELQSYVEKLITLAKRGDLHARRIVATRISEATSLPLAYRKEKSETFDPQESNVGLALEKLFSDIAVRVKDRPGGYTRITKLGFRHGDNAELAAIELVDRKN